MNADVGASVTKPGARPEGSPLMVTVVNGGSSVSGSLRTAGSKIATIPIIAATLLTQEPVELLNVPDLEDVRVLLRLLGDLGARIEREGTSVKILTRDVRVNGPIDAELVASVHGTIYLLPCLLARFGRVTLSTSFGGCRIGHRPTEHLIDVMRTMGADVTVTRDAIVAEAPSLRNAVINADFGNDWDKYRSGRTKTAMLLGATIAEATEVRYAYTRASITSLASFLRALGAGISGEGTSRLRVQGGRLGSARYEIPGDYLEALTYLALLGACGGELEVSGFDPRHCPAELELLRAAGVEVVSGKDGVFAKSARRLRAVSFTTASVDTDIQPIFSAMLATARGRTRVQELVWEDRFQFVSELERMGASIRRLGQGTVRIDGVRRLNAATVRGEDLRGSAALLVAAASADGLSRVGGLEHLRRGYVDLLGAMRRIGVRIYDEEGRDE